MSVFCRGVVHDNGSTCLEELLLALLKKFDRMEGGAWGWSAGYFSSFNEVEIMLLTREAQRVVAVLAMMIGSTRANDAFCSYCCGQRGGADVGKGNCSVNTKAADPEWVVGWDWMCD